MFKLIALAAIVACASAVGVQSVSTPYGAYGYPYASAIHHAPGYHTYPASPITPIAAYGADYHHAAPLTAAYHAPVYAASPAYKVAQSYNSVVHAPAIKTLAAPAYHAHAYATPAYASTYPSYPYTASYAAAGYAAPLAAAYHHPSVVAAPVVAKAAYTSYAQTH